MIDNGAATGNLPGQEFVTIPNSTVKIMKYEASRPDSTDTSAGTTNTHVCSRADVLPWTNVTYPQAQAACSAIGARLCTEAEWQNMCIQQVGAPTYPVAGPATATDYTFIEAEQAEALVAKSTGGTSHSWINDTTSNFSGVRNLLASPNSNDRVSAGNAPSQSARMDFSMNFTAGTYFVWVRMYATSNNDNELFVGINATAGSNADGTALSTNPDGVWRWVVSQGLAVTAGTRTVSVFMREDGVRVDAIAVSKDGVNPPPQTERVWAYANTPKIPQANTCNVDDFDTDASTAGDQDDILTTGGMASCFANGPGAADVFDMTGNVKEWTQARAAGQNPLRGGASNNEINGTTCQLNFTLADNAFFFPNVGFRCCK